MNRPPKGSRWIGSARGLAAALAIPAQFVHANLYDLPDVLEGTFDLVFTSWWRLPADAPQLPLLFSLRARPV